MTSAEIADRWPEEHSVWTTGHDPVRSGSESRVSVAARVAEAVADLAAPLGGEQTLVVVSHGAAITLGLTALLGQDADAWRGLVGLHNAHWSVLRANTSAAHPSWRLQSHNTGPSVQVSDWNDGVPGETLASSAADAMRT